MRLVSQANVMTISTCEQVDRPLCYVDSHKNVAWKVKVRSDHTRAKVE